MSRIDIVLLIVGVVGAVSGYRKGFLASLFSLFAIILGILGAFKLMGVAMVALAAHYNFDDKVLPYVAFALVFVIIVVIVTLVGKALSSSLEKTVLGPVDSWMGAVLGVLKAAFMVSVIFWILQAVSVNFPERWTDDAVIYPVVAEFAPVLTSWISDFAPAFQDVFTTNS